MALAPAALARPKPADPDAISRAQVRAAAVGIRDALASIQPIPGAFPAVAAVVVHGDATPLLYVHGTAHAGEPGEVDRHTRFYIASQTKSFLALLAAHLDVTGELPLATTLAQVWPQLALPAPADPATITLGDLLSHQENLRTDTLNFLTAYVRAVPAADYPAMLSRYTEARPAGFRYANLGDLVYGAALEARTGRTWQDWLQREVLQPMRLDEVHARSSQVPAPQVAWNHRWDGTAWIAYPSKPDELMHAAGGLLASADDMAAWMRANLRRRSPTGSPSPHSFEVAQQPLAKSDLKDGEIDCNGYSLGWYACTYLGQSVLMHPGSYTGVVSVTVLIPSLDAGMALVTTSDSAMEGLQLELMKAFIGAATGHDEAARLHKVVADYPGRLARTVASRADAVRKARDDTLFEGWTWSPADADLARYTGSFHSERLGTLEVQRVAGGLQARLGALRLDLAPARPGLFGASESRIDPPVAFRYADDAASLQWKSDTFVRTGEVQAAEARP
jgi:CubicO group peptidase (beta-lactamase class C family)